MNRLLPTRAGPGDITITDGMLELRAFKLVKRESGRASLSPGETDELDTITEFGANPYTEIEEQSLSKIIDSFNERHGTQFTRDDFLRFEQVNRATLNDKMLEMLRNNSADMVYKTFSDAFLDGMAHSFQKDSEMHNIVMTDKVARDKATRHFFNRALR